MTSTLDAKFAPNYGRSYSLMVTCDINYCLHLWRLTITEHEEKDSINARSSSTALSIEYVLTQNLELSNMFYQDKILNTKEYPENEEMFLEKYQNNDQYTEIYI